MIDIESLTIGEARQLATLLQGLTGVRVISPGVAEAYPLPLNSVVCVQTVTLWYVGVLKAVTPTDLVLVNAAWAADTGRFSTFVKTGDAKEVEPFPDDLPVVISRGAIVAVVPHPKQLRVLQ